MHRLTLTTLLSSFVYTDSYQYLLIYYNNFKQLVLLLVSYFSTLYWVTKTFSSTISASNSTLVLPLLLLLLIHILLSFILELNTCKAHPFQGLCFIMPLLNSNSILLLRYLLQDIPFEKTLPVSCVTNQLKTFSRHKLAVIVPEERGECRGGSAAAGHPSWV